MDVSEVDPRLQCFYLVEGEHECFKCGAVNTLVGFGIPFGPGPERYRAEECRDLFLAPRVGNMPEKLCEYLERKYNYKLRHSGVTGETMYNNVCKHCDTLQGEFFLFNEPGACFTPYDEKGVAALRFLRVHFDGVFEGYPYSVDSLSGMMYKYAHDSDLDAGIRMRGGVIKLSDIPL